MDFNPRSPHGERHAEANQKFRTISISIHAPRTGSDQDDFRRNVPCDISIHAPRTGSDVLEQARESKTTTFQSTLPARGATRMPRSKWPPPCNFNPRSPHGERRGTAARGGGGFRHFNPRSPHGERQSALRRCLPDDCISIHAPRTGSDVKRAEQQPVPRISIHAPRTGSDGLMNPDGTIARNFNPRSPHGERPLGLAFVAV